MNHLDISTDTRSFPGVPGRFYVAHVGGQVISVTWDGGELGASYRGTASADYQHFNQYWWVSRVLVQPSTARSHGVGGKLLELLLGALKEENPTARVVVAPGGYNMKLEKQVAFYKKQGFTDSALGKHVLEWNAHLASRKGRDLHAKG